MDAESEGIYRLHVTAYVMDNFRHLMTEVERVCSDAIVIWGEDENGVEPYIGFSRGKIDQDSEIAVAARAELQEGSQPFRERTSERILLAHQAEVYANACPKCGRLPATPQARLCIWCLYSWIDQ